MIRGGYGLFFTQLEADAAHQSQLQIEHVSLTVPNDGRPDFAVNPFNGPAPSYEQVLATALPWHMDLFGLQAGDGVHLTVAPLYHAAPHMRATQTLHLGHTVVLTDKWHPEEMLKAIKEFWLTHNTLPRESGGERSAAPVESGAKGLGTRNGRIGAPREQKRTSNAAAATK